MVGDSLESGMLLVDKPCNSDDELAVHSSPCGSSQAVHSEGEHDNEEKTSRPKLRPVVVFGSSVFALVAVMAVAWHAVRSPVVRTGPSLNVVQEQVLSTQVEKTCRKPDLDTDYIFEGRWLLLVGSVSGSERCCHLCHGKSLCRAWTWISNASEVEGADPGQCWLKGGTLIQKLPKVGLISALARPAHVESSVDRNLEDEAKHDKNEAP
mmetsp:Transcript_30171/g.76308  ORF Transcript_30171/g.76308 Transcript_30171/m.76308 type:complete len:209 (+) Transcript_30171:91-717(+)|eukprot:CAMPEP_0115419218 /NCGR_PEP_ID=MMETSP0271-20121206/25075_1 /TAXON_ID=71861 /ORGANISM="Scrippsiella trochoidea, Strain CCMP3099" /LENGTH=208 /DNA_ID=CAMNT_0002843727 /DNA_START=36 /DNA_END=662 /DNA_ORIENTATION=+